MGKTIHRWFSSIKPNFRSPQLGYCIKDSPKFHLLSVASNIIQDNDVFVHRILQCKIGEYLCFWWNWVFLGPIQRYRIGLASFDWNYFDEHRLVLLGGKEYFDYVIPSRSTIVNWFSSEKNEIFIEIFRIILHETDFCGQMVMKYIHRSFLKIKIN